MVDPLLATEVQSAGDVTIKLQRVLDAQGHVLLYVHVHGVPKLPPRPLGRAMYHVR